MHTERKQNLIKLLEDKIIIIKLGCNIKVGNLYCTRLCETASLEYFQNSIFTPYTIKIKHILLTIGFQKAIHLFIFAFEKRICF